MKWSKAKLGEVALPTKGAIVSGPFGSSISSKFFVDEGVPVIRGNNLTMGDKKFIDDGFVFLTEEKAGEFKNCEAITDDLVFTAAGTLGQIGIIPPSTKYPKYIISNKQLRVRCDKTKVNPLFVFYWFTTREMNKHIVGRNTGSSIPLINLSILRNLPVPFPPLPTQDRIATFISAYDNLIENNLKRIALLEEAARQLYKEWFVRLRFPGYEQTNIVDGVPEGWGRIPLEDALVLQRGFDLPIQDRQEGEIPIYGSTGISGYHNVAKAQRLGVVTGRSGTLGAVHFVMEDYWPLNTSLWVKDFKRVSPFYAFFLLQEMKLENYNGGVSVPTLDRKAVHRLPVLVAKSTLIDLLDSNVSPMFEMMHKLRNQNQKLKQARDLLLPRLMSGEIPV